MTTLSLHFTLASDTLFGRGDGVAGLVEQEVQHDSYGCPYLGGKTLKGMLVNECADILDAIPENKREHWQQIAAQLFGEPSVRKEHMAKMQVGDAQLPHQVRTAIVQAIESNKMHRRDVLAALTVLRQQTAMDATLGIPLDKSLRTARVIVRMTPFVASLWLDEEADSANTRRLLAACVKAFRRAGTMRNRGYGRLTDVKLLDEQGVLLSESAFDEFCQEVLG